MLRLLFSKFFILSFLVFVLGIVLCRSFNTVHAVWTFDTVRPRTTIAPADTSTMNTRQASFTINVSDDRVFRNTTLAAKVVDVAIVSNRAQADSFLPPCNNPVTDIPCKFTLDAASPVANRPTINPADNRLISARITNIDISGLPTSFIYAKINYDEVGNLGQWSDFPTRVIGPSIQTQKGDVHSNENIEAR